MKGRSEQFTGRPSEAARSAGASAPGRVIAASAAMRAVLDRAARLAATDAPVLIQGETGVGKELLARTIHRQSHRADGPLVHVFCGAVGPGHLETVLFGRDGPRRPGAERPRRGLLEKANGGTLLLDDIDELPRRIQSRVLQALRARSYERPGTGEPVGIDLRAIAATSADLAAAVAGGTFHGPLLDYFYFRAAPIRIPPLRERRQDIRALAEHFLHEFRHLGRSPACGVPLWFSEEAWDCLLCYPWPGNVLELANVIQRSVLFARAQNGGLIGLDQLLGWMPRQASRQPLEAA